MNILSAIFTGRSPFLRPREVIVATPAPVVEVVAPVVTPVVLVESPRHHHIVVADPILAEFTLDRLRR